MLRPMEAETPGADAPKSKDSKPRSVEEEIQDHEGLVQINRCPMDLQKHSYVCM